MDRREFHLAFEARRRCLPPMVGLLLTLGGCESPRSECRKTYVRGSAAFNACAQAVLQRQNALLNQRAREEFRARDR